MISRLLKWHLNIIRREGNMATGHKPESKGKISSFSCMLYMNMNMKSHAQRALQLQEPRG